MDIKDFVFSTQPEAMCKNLLALSRKFKLHQGPMGICIGTALDPREFEKDALKDLLGIVDKVILPKAQEMLKGMDGGMTVETMSEVISLAFSDTIFSIRDIYNIPQEISLPPMLGLLSR